MDQSHFINGEWQSGGGTEFISYNPGNNEIIWRGNAAIVATVQTAVTAAHAAFKQWSSTSLALRMELLEKFKEEVQRHQAELAIIISNEVGKPFWEAITEVAAVINKVDISITAYKDRTGTKTQKNAGVESMLQHRPHGVLAVLGPYNFPAHLPHGHIIPALLAGNTLIFKPSEFTPMVAEFMLKLWEKADLPPGVLNLVQGGRSTGQALVDQSIKGILFTGSYQTGRFLHARYAGQPEKILALEMGGNNPLIVSDIEDIDAACYQTIQSAFITSGQRCTCARRLILPKGSREDRFLERLVELTARIQVGPNTLRPEPFMGPVISKQAAIGFLDFQAEWVKKRGKSLLEMRHLDSKTGLVSPGIIDVTRVKPLADQEIFGPLLQVIRSQDFSHALHIANETQYGLSAGLLSDNAAYFQQFYQEIRAGIITWNRPTTGASSSAPFGGIGHSGNHRPSAYYAADYCAYPVSSMQQEKLTLPATLSPGIFL